MTAGTFLSIISATTAASVGAGLSLLPVEAALGLSVVAITAMCAMARSANRTNLADVPGWDVQAVVFVLALNLLATDILVLGQGWGPYALACLVAAAALCGHRTGARVAGDTVLLVLLVWGLAGSMYGRLALGQAENTLAFFVPACVASLHVWRPLQVGEPGQARRLVRVLMYASLGYGVVAYIVLVRGWTILPASDFKHERVYFVAIAVVAAVVLRAWLVLGAVILLAAAAFLSYPALTWLLVAAATATVVAATGRRLGPVVLAVGGLLTVLVVLTADGLGTLRTAYFASVGKADNTATREVLLHLGLRRFSASPVIGDGFTANIAVPSDVTGPFRRVPVHNDFLQFAMSGGVLGGGLFLVWALVLVVGGVWSVRSLRARRLPDHAALALVATVGVVGVLVTAAFNPILINAQTSLLLGMLAGVLAGVRLATRTGRPEPAAVTS